MTVQFQFVMRSGPTPGATFSLEGEQILIGRDASNGVAINDPEVSRRHARLTFQGGKYVLEDLGSTNGTFVNGQRVTGPVVLKSGDVITLGEQIVLMFEALSADAGATAVVSRKSAPRPAAPPPPAPVAAPPPYQAPAPQYQAPAAPTKTSSMLPLFIGAGVLLVLCLCGAALWYIDANYLWCTFLPFLAGC